MRIAFLFLFFAAFAGFAVARDDDGLSLMPVPFEHGSLVPPTVSVFYDLDYSGLGSKQPRTVIACIWPDGRAVWSGDRDKGGPPYFTGQVELKRLRAFIAVLSARGFFERKIWFSVAVDAPHHDINILDGKRRVALSASYGYATGVKTPFLITKTEDAMACFRQQFERLLPSQGRKLRVFDYKIRQLP